MGEFLEMTMNEVNRHDCLNFNLILIREFENYEQSHIMHYEI